MARLRFPSVEWQKVRERVTHPALSLPLGRVDFCYFSFVVFRHVKEVVHHLSNTQKAKESERARLPSLLLLALHASSGRSLWEAAISKAEKYRHKSKMKKSQPMSPAPSGVGGLAVAQRQVTLISSSDQLKGPHFTDSNPPFSLGIP